MFQFFERPFVCIASFLITGVLIGFYFTSLPILMIAALGLGSVIGFYLLNSLKSPFRSSLFLVLSFVLLGILLMYFRTGNFQENQFQKFYKQGDLVGVIIKEVAESKGQWKKALAEVQYISRGQSIDIVSEPLVLYVQSNKGEISEGDKLLFNTTVALIRNKNNPGEFDAETYWKRKGYCRIAYLKKDDYEIIEHGQNSSFSAFTRGTRRYLASIFEHYLSGDELAIALALVLGDKGLISQEVSASFTNTGAMHVLAVSGLHIGIILQILMKVLGSFPRFISQYKAQLIAIIIMWIYAIITGLSPSVLRAVFMFSVLSFAQISGRNYDSLNALFFTGFVLVVIDPLTVFDIGFQLSFLAMLGIFLFYPYLRQMVYFSNKWISMAWEGTAIGLAAQIMTTPISLYYFHQFPNYFLLTNLGLMASSAAILGLGLGVFTFGWVPLLGSVVAYLLMLSVYFSLLFIRWVEELPGAVAYGFNIGFLTVSLCFIIALLLLLPIKHRFYRYSLFLIILGVIGSISWARHNQLNSKEICVFNFPNALVCIKLKQKLLCFHDAKPEEMKKLKNTVAAYQKLNPGEAHYYRLTNRKYAIECSGHRIEICPAKGAYYFDVDGYFFTIRKNEWIKKVKGEVINMPWVKSKEGHHLKDGCFRKRL